MINFRVLLLITFVSVQNAYAINWGHLLTGTTETLEKDEVTVGTGLLGYGVSERVTIGFSPMAYLGYDFYSLIGRFRIYENKNYSLGLDTWYFKSIPEMKENSSFEQESIFIKSNFQYSFSQMWTLNTTYGYQKFSIEKSPYSLRPDPLGKWNVFAIKSDNERIYKEKLLDFKNEERSSETHSLTFMPTLRFNKKYYLNFEVGVLGLFYNYPLFHRGLSLNFEDDRWDLSLGMSRSSRETPFIGSEELLHTETKIQYRF